MICRTPRGVRELKQKNGGIVYVVYVGRTPRGVRELKL